MCSSDLKMACSDVAVPVDANRGGANELCVAAKEPKRARLQLMSAVGSEVGDEGVLPCEESLHVDSHGAGIDSPCTGRLDGVPKLCGMKEGLGGHATAKDAEAAEPLRAVHHGDVATAGRHGSRRREPGRAGSNNHRIEVHRGTLQGSSPKDSHKHGIARDGSRGTTEARGR